MKSAGHAQVGATKLPGAVVMLAHNSRAEPGAQFKKHCVLLVSNHPVGVSGRKLPCSL